MNLLLMLTLAVGHAQADPPQLPDRPAEAEPPDEQCEQAMPIRQGDPLDPELVDGMVARCNAVAVPTTTLAHLMALEGYGDEVAGMYQMEVGVLVAERDSLAYQLEQAQQPAPWLQRPQTQRWLGRLEVVAVVGLTAGVAVAVYRATE